jgi:hypothetical protein
VKNKRLIGFQSWNILLIFGMTIALLVSTSSSQMMSASVEGGSPGPNNSNSNQGDSQGSVPPNNADVSCEEDPMCGQAIDHINQAQSALQKGDTAGAQSHLDSAKKALLCEGCEPTN